MPAVPYDPFNRREFLQTAAAAAVTVAGAVPSSAAGPSWNPGDLVHLIPMANHQRLLIKASFRAPLAEPPRLQADKQEVTGRRTDSHGRFWQFDLTGLQPATEYELRLPHPARGALCDPWPIKTFPAPDAAETRLHILAYTCAGGHDGPLYRGKTLFLNLAARRRLLERGLASSSPTAITSTGTRPRPRTRGTSTPGSGATCFGNSGSWTSPGP